MVDDLNSITGGSQSDEEFDRLEDELGRLARELTGEDIHLEAPPIDLWSRIEAEADAPIVLTDVDGSFGSSPPGEHGVTQLRPSRIGSPRGLGEMARTPGSAKPPVSGARSGLYGIPAALAVAAVLALVLATGAALIVRLTNSEVTVAEAAIGNDGLPVQTTGSGTAVLKQRGDDQFLELELPALDAADPNSIYEIWMIDTDVDGMVSLGSLAATDGETTRIDLPDTIDHTAFPVVDISVEPLDGDPTHSGQSVLRGVLADVDDA